MIIIAALAIPDSELKSLLNMKEPCNAANQNCKDEHCTDTCFSCGLPVCTQPGCSLMTPYLRYGEQRICSNCLEQRWDESDELMEAVQRVYFEQCTGAGMPEKHAKAQADEWFELLTT